MNIIKIPTNREKPEIIPIHVSFGNDNRFESIMLFVITKLLIIDVTMVSKYNIIMISDLNLLIVPS